ncbi:MAG TPA: hypothetical protein VMU75_01515 [Acidimicrobiales bacterium]|nr:hypothetical protein [Acidimicrobiales bacterium]
MSANAWLEVRRRSLAMLPPGAPSGLSREEALELIAELQRLRTALDESPGRPDEHVRALRRHPSGGGAPEG